MFSFSFLFISVFLLLFCCCFVVVVVFVVAPAAAACLFVSLLALWCLYCFVA